MALCSLSLGKAEIRRFLSEFLERATVQSQGEFKSRQKLFWREIEGGEFWGCPEERGDRAVFVREQVAWSEIGPETIRAAETFHRDCVYPPT